MTSKPPARLASGAPQKRSNKPSAKGADQPRTTQGATGAGHGGPARGYSWPPAEPGNTLALKHGSYATLQLAPRAAEIAATIRERKGDAWSDEFAPAAETAALALARVERALGFLLELDEETIEEQYARLDDRAKGWVRLALQNLEALAMTPKVSAGEASGPVTIIVGTAFPNVQPAADLTLEPADVHELPEEAS